METPSLVTRELKIANSHGEIGASACEKLRALDGVIDVVADPGRGTVTVSYDMGVLTLADVAERLEALGLKPAGGLFARLARAGVAFSEKNKRASLKHQGHCCSKPPGR